MSEIIKYTPVYYTEVNGWDSAEMRASETGDYIKVSDLDRDVLERAIKAIKSQPVSPHRDYAEEDADDHAIAHLAQLRDIAPEKA